MNNDIREEQLASTTPPEEQPSPSPKQHESERAEELSVGGFRNNFAGPLSENQIETNPASQSYSSSLTLSSDDSIPVDGRSLHQATLSVHLSDTTGRMEVEPLTHETQATYLSGFSEPVQVNQQPPAFLAPEPSRFRSNREAAEYWLKQIYEKIRLIDVDEIAGEPVRGALKLILPLIFANYNPEDPTCPDPRIGAHKVKLLFFMRRDQYVKKAWSHLKAVVREELRQEPEFEVDYVFENIFGRGTFDSLKIDVIEYIIRNYTLFRMIFNREFFRNLREELNKQTLRDIEAHFLKKLDGYLTGAEGGREEAMAHFRADRSVKTPFTFLENNTSLIILVNQFIKQLMRIEMDRAGNMQRMNTLTALREELINYADIRKWTLPGCRFKRSQIVSFVSG